VQRGRHGEPEGLSSLEIDHQLELSRLLDRKIGWLGTFQDAIDVRCGSPVEIGQVNAVGNEPAACGKGTDPRDCRQTIFCR
jgi:hypothetical protein